MALQRTADFYVILEPRGGLRAAAVGTRMSRPGTAWDQIAVRIKLTLPLDAFAGWVPVVEAEVAPNYIIPPTAEVLEPEPIADSIDESVEVPA